MADPLERLMLQLELLSYNFHESLHLGPFFDFVDRRIDFLSDSSRLGDRRNGQDIRRMDKYRNRLHKLGRNIVSKQVETIERFGDVDSKEIYLDFLTWHQYLTAFNYSSDNKKKLRGLYDIIPDSIRAKVFGDIHLPTIINDEAKEKFNKSGDVYFGEKGLQKKFILEYLFDIVAQEDTTISDEECDSLFSLIDNIDENDWILPDENADFFYLLPPDTLSLEENDVEYFVEVNVGIDKWDVQHKELKVRLATKPYKINKRDRNRKRIYLTGGKADASKAPPFHVGYFDFPLIDNTRLAEDLRFAIYLKRWDEESIELGYAFFPGYCASLRAKPYYKEVLMQLLDEG